jgi:hypothetical protein
MDRNNTTAAYASQHLSARYAPVATVQSARDGTACAMLAAIAMKVWNLP